MRVLNAMKLGFVFACLAVAVEPETASAQQPTRTLYLGWGVWGANSQGAVTSVRISSGGGPTSVVVKTAANASCTIVTTGLDQALEIAARINLLNTQVQCIDTQSGQTSALMINSPPSSSQILNIVTTF